MSVEDKERARGFSDEVWTNGELAAWAPAPFVGGPDRPRASEGV
jgi:hypothetical protein